jgi:nucleoside-diphosphate-sugar epimerase
MPHAEPTPITAPSLVVVTGANGFIASHTVQTLLRAGFEVCGTVRSASKAEAVTRTVQQLNSPEVAARFTTAVVPDITDPAAYLDLFRTTQPAAVLHLASPFAYTVTNFEKDLMEPAVKGTLAVLEAAAVTPSVRRVVHTNSFACIYDANLGMRPGYTYTAKDWCPLTYADGMNAANAPTAYRASKAVAEKTAWEFLDSHRDAHFDLVSLCPAMVFGPFLDTPDALPSSPAGLNTSNQLVWDVLRAGEDASMPPTKGPVWVDVRDVADAHVRALEVPELGGRRFLLAKGVYCSQEIADVAREVLPPKHRHRVPIGVLGKSEAENHFAVDASVEEKLLGTGGKWRELRETLADLGPQLYGIETRASAIET